MTLEGKFVVSRFKNRNGGISWRESGWLDGVRIRRNIKTRNEAAASKSSFGLREILKLLPENIRLDTGVILIESEISKVRMKRIVAIQPNLAAWLRASTLNRYPIIFPHLHAYRKHVAERFGLSHDIMRHTFIFMFVAKFRSMGEF